MIDRRVEGHEIVSHMDKDAKSSHFEDAKRGEVLVSRRVLLSGDNELEQRRILFHTRCMYEDKCCDVIINSRSIENILSNEMLANLNLK